MSVHGLPARRDDVPVRVPERYLTRVELAEILNLSLSKVDRLVREGLPSETWGLRSRRFLLSRVEAWLREREAGRIAA